MQNIVVRHPKLGQIRCLLDRDNSIVRILGIPYGKIDQRFARSKISTSLSIPNPERYDNKKFDATYPGPSSIQPYGSVRSDASNIPLPTDNLPSDEEQSEDCLNLSIHVCSTVFAFSKTSSHLNSNAKLPVLVFIHGGAYFLGSGNRPYYNPTGLMRHSMRRKTPTPFILVGVNYRLGALGFFHCPGAPDLVPPNNGLFDQLLALQWIKNNIEGFGGDVENVSIIGQSAGGESISLHAYTAAVSGMKSRSLYKRAIMMSGSPVTMPAKTPEEYESIFYDQAEKLGIQIKDVEGERLNARDVAQRMIEVPVDKIRDLGFVGLPCTNTDLLPYDKPTMEMMKSGLHMKDDWVEAQILGAATFDGGISYNMISRDSERQSHARSFIKVAKEVLGPEYAKQLCNIYFLTATTNDKTALKQICLFESDIGFFTAAYTMAQGTHSRTRTYLQLFNLGNPFKGPITEDHPNESFPTHTFDIVTLLGGNDEDRLPKTHKNAIAEWRESILDFVVDGKEPCTEFSEDGQHALVVEEGGVRDVDEENYLGKDSSRRRRLLGLADAIGGDGGRDKLWVDVCRRWLMKGK